MIMRHPGVEPGSQEPESWVLSITLAAQMSNQTYLTVQYVILAEVSHNIKSNLIKSVINQSLKKHSERKRIHWFQSVALILYSCYNSLVRKVSC